MNILITGSNGFIGKNLYFYLKQKKNLNIITFNRSNSKNKLLKLIKKTDIIIHTAGTNRSINKTDFKKNNEDLTKFICKNISNNQKIIFTSSIQATLKNKYGISKKNCENIIKNWSYKNKFSYLILRVPNVFGKWSKPNYNSVIATYCYNLSRNKKVKLNNPNSAIKLIYIDDLTRLITKYISIKKIKSSLNLKNYYSIKLKDIYKTILGFKEIRNNLNIDDLGNNFKKKLYSTYLSYIPLKDINKNLKNNIDVRGSFKELIKSKKNGQMSCVIIKSKQQRGNHFHFTKIERFFPIYGKGKFLMENIIDKKKKIIEFSAKKPQMIETIPGYAHKIVNNSKTDTVLLIWTNEIYNKNKPDTYYYNL